MSERSPILLASIWMMGALASFSAMGIAGRELSSELTTFQILFFRGAVGLIIVSAALSRSGWGQIRPHKLGIHVVRNIAHFSGQYGWFFAIAYIPLAEVFAIEFTTPIWVAFLATFLLGERMTPARWIAVGLGFAGVMVILRPGAEAIQLASLAALGAALGYSLSHTLTRKLAGQDSPLCILFYMTVLQLPMALFPALPDWAWPTGGNWFWVVIVGATGLSAHYSMTRAFKLAEATVVVPMDFLRVPLIAVVGYVFYAEPFEVWTLVGAAIILGGILINLRDAERRRQR